MSRIFLKQFVLVYLLAKWVLHEACQLMSPASSFTDSLIKSKAGRDLPAIHSALLPFHYKVYIAWKMKN